MKLLHTADWHLGRLFHGASLVSDQALLLDRRVQEKPYGTTILRSLPPARRVTGPWQRVRQELIEVFAGAPGAPTP